VHGDDGAIHLTASQSGIYGDYYITVCALKENENPEYITIKIIGAILPDHIEIQTAQLAVADARKFYMCDAMGTQMPLLSGKIRNANNNTIRDAYVLTSVNQKVEFYPITVDGATPSNVQWSNIRYSLTPSLLTSYTQYTQLRGVEDIAANRIDDGVLFYTKSATHNGIVLGVSALPNDIALYELNVNVTVGERAYVKTVNILVYNDNIVMHRQTTSAAVQTVLNALHQTLYGNVISNYYKSDLLSLAGTLDFTSQTTAVSTIVDENGDLLFTHLKNISAIDLTGCVNVQISNITSSGVFPTMPNL
jgi:hypothetical protein